MTRKMLFFINPVSGTKSKFQLEKKITDKCQEQGVAFDILFTSREGDYRFLRDRIGSENCTDIVIAGGDGSIRPIVSAVLDLPVRIGIIPVGSGNGLAKTAGIPSAVDKALEVALNARSASTDAFLINEQLATHVCGLGFDAKVAHDFSVAGHRGLNAYTKIAVKNFTSAKTYPFRVEADGKSFEVDAFLIVVANSNQFGNNFKVAPQASICDGLLDVVVIKKTGKLRAALSLAGQLLGGKAVSLHSAGFHRRNVLYFQTASIKIQNPRFAPLHIDGDPAESVKSYSIQVLPSAYHLIVP